MRASGALIAPPPASARVEVGLELEAAHEAGGRAQPVGGAAAMVADRREVAREQRVDVGDRRLGIHGAAGERGFELRGAHRARRHAAIGGAQLAHLAAVDASTRNAATTVEMSWSKRFDSL